MMIIFMEFCKSNLRIYIYTCIQGGRIRGRFFVRLILPMFCRFGVSVIFEPFLKNLDRSED